MEDGLAAVTQTPWAFQSALQQNLYWFLHPQSRVLDAEGEHVVAQVARLLAASYGQIQFPDQPLDAVTKHVPPFVESEYLAEDAHYRKPIAELARFSRERLAPYLSHFFLHGSLATLDYCRGWSDVDTLLVVSRETATDPRRLCALRALLHQAYAYLTAIDPLQHHGFIVTTEIDCQCYPISAMPPVVLDGAISLLPGAGMIDLRCRNTDNEIRNAVTGRVALFRDAVGSGVFRHHPRHGVYLKAHWQNADDAMYQLKYFLSVIMIQPAYLLEATGRRSLKGDSFALCRDILADQWAIIDRASTVRREWPNHENHPFRGNAIPDWVRECIGDDYFERGLDLVQAVAEYVASSEIR